MKIFKDVKVLYGVVGFWDDLMVLGIPDDFGKPVLWSGDECTLFETEAQARQAIKDTRKYARQCGYETKKGSVWGTAEIVKIKVR